MSETTRPARRQGIIPEWAIKGLELLFLVLSGVYLAYSFSGMVTLFIPYPPWFETALLWAMTAVAAARLAVLGPKRWQTWLALALAGMYSLVYRSDGYRFLLFLAAMTAGLAGIHYRRILKSYLVAVWAMLLVCVLAALSGAIANIVYYRDGLRSSWGIAYPTDFSSILLFALLALWVWARKLPDWAMLPPALASVLLALFITQSRNGLLCSAAFCVAIAYRMAEARFMGRRSRLRWLRRDCDGLMTAAFPLCACVTFLMVYLYSRDTALGERLNALMSDRLVQCLAGFRSHPITAFGVPFDQIGRGFSAYPPTGYNFIDSSYVLILLRYGWVALAAMCGMWIYMTRRAIRLGDRRLALALGLIALHSVTEHHFTEVHFNILLVMPLALYAGRPSRRRDRLASKQAWAVGATAAAALVALWIGLPRVLTRLRTVFAALGWQGGGRHAVPVMLVVLGLLMAAAGLCWALYRLICAALARKKPRWQAPAALLLSLGLAIVGWRWSVRVVDAAAVDSASKVEAEAEGLGLILDSATGPVYVDDLPDVYRRQFPGISPTVLTGDDLCRRKGSTAIMDAQTEYNPFFFEGFRYAKLSHAHSVYTDDPAVIAALEGAGYAVKEYYNTVHYVRLRSQAKLNGLEYSAQEGLLVTDERPMGSGPYIDVYGGSYRVEFRMALPERVGNPDDVVCMLYATAYWGSDIVAERPVTLDEFDGEGNARIRMDFTTDSVRAMEFKLFPLPGRQLRLTRVSYVKTGP